jgi:hypothetical protein
VTDDAERNVVRLVTLPEREAADAQVYADESHAEAVAMLERALEIVKARPTACVAIAFAFADRSFGNHIPTAGNDVGLLLGAIADMEYQLHRRNNDGREPM